jgi:hypothetical protein
MRSTSTTINARHVASTVNREMTIASPPLLPSASYHGTTA